MLPDLALSLGRIPVILKNSEVKEDDTWATEALGVSFQPPPFSISPQLGPPPISAHQPGPAESQKATHVTLCSLGREASCNAQEFGALDKAKEGSRLNPLACLFYAINNISTLTV